MEGWLSTHSALIVALIALFGAGGAGTLVLKHLLARGKKSSDHNIHTEASGNSKVVTHLGTGDVSINDTISTEQYENWRMGLALSRAGAANLPRALSLSSLSLNRFDEILSSRRVSSDAKWERLIVALERNDVSGASSVLRELDTETN